MLRKPYIRTHADELLNMSFVLAASDNYFGVLDKIVKALNHQGLSEKDVKTTKTDETLNIFGELTSGLPPNSQNTAETGNNIENEANNLAETLENSQNQENIEIIASQNDTATIETDENDDRRKYDRERAGARQ